MFFRKQKLQSVRPSFGRQDQTRALLQGFRKFNISTSSWERRGTCCSSRLKRPQNVQATQVTVVQKIKENGRGNIYMRPRAYPTQPENANTYFVLHSMRKTKDSQSLDWHTDAELNRIRTTSAHCVLESSWWHCCLSCDTHRKNPKTCSLYPCKLQRNAITKKMPSKR